VFIATMNLQRAHELARTKGVNPVVYWIVRTILQPFFHLYFRIERMGREHIPAQGPVLLASNHRSFSDPFLIGICLRRPLRFVAKKELFDRWWKARLLVALGAFPIDRGESDEQAMETARLILESGGAVGIFPEGTRVRPGPLGDPKRGVGRLALETGAPVVPVAIIGTEDIRSGWRIRPRKVRVRFGKALTFPRPVAGSVAPNLPQVAHGITARVWSCISLQWEWLGGVAPIRTAAVVGAGSWGTAAAVLMARGGAAVRLGCRTGEQAVSLESDGRNHRYLPGVELPAGIAVSRADALELSGVEVVCLAVPSRSLPAAVEALAGRIPAGVGILLLTKGLMAPDGKLPCDYVRERLGERPIALLGGPAHAQEACAGEAGLVVASSDPIFGSRAASLFRAAGLECEVTDDVVGVQLAGCAKNAAALAVGMALPSVNAAGTAAGRIYGECYALARTLDAREHSFAGLAGAGDLVATVLASHSRNRRAGELLGRGASVPQIEQELGQAAEALALVPLLADAMKDAGVGSPATERLAAAVAQANGQRQRPAGGRRSARAA
jgi:glycerol-3-phosphate dehydrogenase (NAD(P)+)